ncbi:DUF5825 family protein [Nonomuraea sp. NPDC050536]|uniref:DUF5825 family protein n=1 Tax=Nonomuraea sp. NPDC050536 TaxID=3364366 RepID=UPI0037CACAD4
MDKVALTLSRDYNQKAAALGGMSLGVEQLRHVPSAHAQDLFQRGCRKVSITKPLDLRQGSDASRAAEALMLVRELTGIGIFVDWTLQVDKGFAWKTLSHLFPPAAVDGAEDGAVEQWLQAFRMGRLAYRRGPGFIQVRDLRWGGVRRYTIDKRQYLEVAEALDAGAPIDDIPPRVLSNLVSSRLVMPVGSLVCWLPMRMRRWPDR